MVTKLRAVGTKDVIPKIRHRQKEKDRTVRRDLTHHRHYIEDGPAPVRPFHLHVSVGTRDQVTCFAADSRLDGAGPFSGRKNHRVRVSLPSLPLAKGEFVVNAYLVDDKGLAIYDARSDLSFHVDAEGWKSGLFEVEAVWERLG